MTATRRDVINGAIASLYGLSAPEAIAAARPTNVAYRPPQRSQQLLARVPFDGAVRAGENFTKRFARWDRHVGDRNDPSRCKGIYRLSNGNRRTVFWESKMAVDTDGAEAIPGDTGTHQPDTSKTFSDRKAIDALTVPYFVIPSKDTIGGGRKKFPTGPWEGSGDDFGATFNLPLCTLGVVVFENKITGAILADTGPSMKIGEASIRVHELIRGPQHPWRGNTPRQELNPNDGQDGKVLYFAFPGLVFDIERFGSSRQAEMAEEIRRQGVQAFNDFIVG